jgi:hypothetical protein
MLLVEEKVRRMVISAAGCDEDSAGKDAQQEFRLGWRLD